MLSQKIEEKLLWLTQGLLFAALAAPFLGSKAFLFPYLTPGIFGFQFLVEGATLCWLALIIVNPQNYRPRMNRPVAVLAIFSAVQILLLAFSANPMRSLLGSLERMDGVWNILHYLLFLIVALSVIKEEKTIRRFISFSLLVSALVALRYVLFNIGTVLPYATFSFGNPGFLANYLMLHLPFAVWLMATSRDREVKLMLGLLMILHSGIIIHSGNRAAFLAWFTGLLVFGGFFALRNKKIRAGVTAGLIVILLGFGALIALRQHPLVHNTYFLQKITTWSFNDATIQNRLIMAGIAWKGFLENPAFGWGRENFPLVFKKYYNPDFYNYNSAELWMDRAHNVPLDELVNGGVIGILAAILLLGGLTVSLVRLAKEKPEQKVLVVSCVVLLGANFIQTFFTLDTLGIYLPASLAFFLVAAHLREEKLSGVLAPEIARGAATLGIPALLAGAVFFSLFPLLGNYRVAQSLFLIPKDFPAFAQYYRKLDGVLDDSNPYKAELMLIAGKGFSDIAARRITDPQLIPFQEVILQRLQREVALHPDYVRLKADYAVNLGIKARRTRRDEDFQASLKVWEELMHDAPRNQFIFVGTTGTYIIWGTDAAKQRAVELVYKILDTSKKTERMYWDSGSIMQQAGRPAEAADFFAKGIELNYKPKSIIEIINVGNFLMHFPEKLSSVRDLYLIAISLYPNDANLHANLAFIYAKMGDKQRAIEEAKKAAELDPSHKEDIEKFIRML